MKMSPDELECMPEGTALSVEEWRRVRAHIAVLETERDEWQKRALNRDLQVTQLTTERDAALADNAAKTTALEDAQSFMTVLVASLHESENEREREVLANINGALHPHPGAVLLEVVDAIRQHQRADEPDVFTTFRRLLEERGRIAHMVDPEQHRKALASARNEGLEEVASHFDREADVNPGTQWARTCRSHAEYIRAMIKPVPCCERDHDGDGNCDRHPRTAL